MHLRKMTLVASFAILGVSQAASASLLGDSITAEYYIPDLSSPYPPARTQTVTSSGALYAGFGGGVFDVTVTPSRIIADNFAFEDSFSADPFNGFVLTDNTKPFDPVFVDALTNMVGFDSSRITVSGNQLFINWQGLLFNTGTKVVLDVGAPSAVPLPPAALLFMPGLGLLGFMARRKKTVQA
jgi:hypothetical protein